MRVLSLRLHPHAEPGAFNQAPGVLPVRRETIEGIGCCRMPSVHPAGAQCKVGICRGAAACYAQHLSGTATLWPLGRQLSAGHLEEPAEL